jgi:hypothetical protein
MSKDPALLRRLGSRLFLWLWPVLLLLPAAHAADSTAPVPATNATPSTTTAAPSTHASPAAPLNNGQDSDSSRRERSSRSSATTKAAADAPGGTATTTTNAAPPGSFESFRLIAERNIFDQSRSPRAPRGTQTGAPPPRPPRIEAIALAGTMIYSNRHLAFFTSSNPQYQKALKPGDAIAGYRLAEVTLGHVRLEKDGETVELKVRQQLRREDDGPWQLSASTEMVSSTTAAPSSGAGGGGSPVGPSSGGGSAASDLLRRLMEQRAKEQQ